MGTMEDDRQSSEPEIPVNRILQFYKIPLIIGAVSVLLIAISVVLLVKSVQTTTPIQFSALSGEATQSAKASLVTVDIEGAVAKPGLYQLPTGSRVEDAIILAGNVTSDIDAFQFSQTINRATKLVDGAKLYIPKKGENINNNIVRHDTSSSSIPLVNINTASQSELESLPGIGPVTAQKIISNRPYQTLEELVAKKPMNQTLFTKLKDRLSL